MPKSSSPEGLHLDATSSKKWQISKKLGSGACGTVHALLKTSGKASLIQYAVKLAILPPPSKNKKKKKSAIEKNADLLNHENILYRNVLNDLRGNMIPEVPLAGSKGPIGFGDLKEGGGGDGYGYRFLVMERMESSFESIIPTLCSTSSTGTTAGIEIGPIAVRLIKLMEAIHSTHHVFVDVKPENFMLAHAHSAGLSSSSKSKSSKAASLADRMRMIDLGLMESSKDVMKNKHRANQHPDAQLVGTPVYASINVLSGHTVSRRDDLEACIYIILELILQIQYFIDNGRGKIPDDLLSWSNAQSDEEIKRLKEEAVDLDSGSIWTLVGKNGNHALKDTMKEVFGIVTSLDFKEKPDYDDLAHKLSKLKIKLQTSTSGKAKSRSSSNRTKENAESSSTKRKAQTASTASKNVKQAPHSSQPSPVASTEKYDEDVPPTSTTSSRASRAAKRAATKREQVDSDSDIEMISVSEGKSEKEEDDDMDWEIVTDENEPLNTASNSKSESAKQSEPSLRLECIDGPHSGESITLTSSLVIGTNPKKTKSHVFAITKDNEASLAHTKFVLNCSGPKKKGLLTVKVFDLKSNTGTIVNGKVLPKGSSRQAFVRDKIQVGESIFRILKN